MHNKQKPKQFSFLLLRSVDSSIVGLDFFLTGSSGAQGVPNNPIKHCSYLAVSRFIPDRYRYGRTAHTCTSRSLCYVYPREGPHRAPLLKSDSKVIKGDIRVFPLAPNRRATDNI